MIDNQVKTYSTKCEIEYSQEYLKRRDITIIFEDTFVMGKDVNGNPEKYMARERICGFYHGEPDEQSLEDYLAKGCEAFTDGNDNRVREDVHVNMTDLPEGDYSLWIANYPGDGVGSKVIYLSTEH